MSLFERYLANAKNDGKGMFSEIFDPMKNLELLDEVYDFYGAAMEKFVEDLEFQQITFDKWLNFGRDDAKDPAGDDVVAPPAEDDVDEKDDVEELPGTTTDDKEEDIVDDAASGQDRLNAALDKLGEKVDAAADFWKNFGAAGSQMVALLDPWSSFALDRCDDFLDTPQQIKGDKTSSTDDDVWVLYSRDDAGNLVMSWGRSKKEVQAALDAYTDNKEELALFEPLLSVDDSWKDGWDADKDKTSKSEGALSVGFLPW